MGAPSEELRYWVEPGLWFGLARTFRAMSACDKPRNRSELRSYGRRRGRKRSPRQERIFDQGLTRWGLDVDDQSSCDPYALFPTRPKEIWLEIGFGGGEHLIWQAEHNPSVGFIGAEPFEDGVVKVLSAIEEKSLRNVRVLPGDVRPFLRTVAPGCIDRVFILFPDPWPKARHTKRRIISKHLLDLLAHACSDRANIRIGTDIASYASVILQTVHHHPEFTWQVREPSDWRTRPPDWPGTRYEAKAIRAGRKPYFFHFQHLKLGKQTIRA